MGNTPQPPSSPSQQPEPSQAPQPPGSPGRRGHKQATSGAAGAPRAPRLSRLRRLEERYDALTRASGQIIWVANAGGQAEEDLPSWRAYTGQTPEQARGRGWLDALHPDDRDEVAQMWATALVAGQVYTSYHRIRRHDGVYRAFVVRATPLLAPDGAVREWVGTCGDVEDLVAVRIAQAGLLAQLAARVDDLAAANRRMDTFLSVAGHELRTPLTSAFASVQMMQRIVARTLAPGPDRSAPDRATAARMERLGDLLARSRRQQQRQMRLVDDLLDVSRIQAGALELRRAASDLVALVREWIDDERQAYPEPALALELAAERAPVWVDGDRIGQVVTNFLSNARTFSPPNQPLVVRIEARGGVARVSVRDHGPGLPPEEHERVWQRFYRSPGMAPASGAGGGMGLGLAICRGIIERHGGTVGVTSAPGQGATFWFEVPLAPAVK